MKSSGDLVPALKESLLLVQLKKLTARLNSLQESHRNGSLGPRVVRARLRIIAHERNQLAAKARSLGYNIE